MLKGQGHQRLSFIYCMCRSFLKFRNYCDIDKNDIKSLLKLPLSLQRYILLIADKEGSS